jgi:hypothetical protein
MVKPPGAEPIPAQVIPMIFGYVMGTRAVKRAAAMGVVADNMIGRGVVEQQEFDERLDRMLLVIQAMWDLLKDHGYTDEQLLEKIKEIDLADGVEDGHRTTAPIKCSKCGSAVARNLAKCQFCGTDTNLPTDPMAGL